MQYESTHVYYTSYASCLVKFYETSASEPLASFRLLSGNNLITNLMSKNTVRKREIQNNQETALQAFRVWFQFRNVILHVVCNIKGIS